MSAKPVLGVIVGNRGFFPDHLAKEGRTAMLEAVKEAGARPVCVNTKDTSFGAVETWEESKTCAELFKKHRDELIGVVVTLPNFGEERGIVDALKMANLDVPVLVQATPDDPASMARANRRDSFCGKMSTCNNLRQYGIKYTLTTLHTEAVDSDLFKHDLENFVMTCRVVKALKNARIGAIGARPAAFNTVRYSEKLLEATGVSVETIDLSEIFGQAERLKGAEVTRFLNKIKDYQPCGDVPEDALDKMARLGIVIDRWMKEKELDASAVQCWTAIEEFYGVVPCTVMSMMSNRLLPSACEVDVCGAVGMYAMAAATDRPSALLDWNNNYGDDPDKCVVFHCSNLPRDIFESTRMDFQEIIADTVGKENTFGTCVGRIKPGPFSYLRVSTDDCEGTIRAYTGEGELTDDALETFGGYGVAHIPNLQELLRTICEFGFEHHVAINPSQCAAAVFEALSNYLEWDVYLHE
jgi:L-fucose isomerase-like protein